MWRLFLPWHIFILPSISSYQMAWTGVEDNKYVSWRNGSNPLPPDTLLLINICHWFIWNHVIVEVWCHSPNFIPLLHKSLFLIHDNISIFKLYTLENHDQLCYALELIYDYIISFKSFNKQSITPSILELILVSLLRSRTITS